MDSTCRICYCNSMDEQETLISPCYCKGSQANVHKSCLEMWLYFSGRQSCEICRYCYKVQRSLRHSKPWLLYYWMVNRGNHKEPVYFMNQLKLLTYLLPALIIAAVVLQSVPNNLCYSDYFHLDVNHHNHMALCMLYFLANQVFWLFKGFVWIILLMGSLMMVTVYAFLITMVTYFQIGEWTKWLDKHTVITLVVK